jgi:hypothetical protein
VGGGGWQNLHPSRRRGGGRLPLRGGQATRAWRDRPVWLGRSAATVAVEGGGANDDEEGMGEKRSFSRASAEPNIRFLLIYHLLRDRKNIKKLRKLLNRSKLNIFMNKLMDLLNHI